MKEIEIPTWMGRTQLLMGNEPIQNLMNSNVLVVGLGGVGGICAEMLARAGIGKMTIVDADVVEPSNRNRQIPALSSTHNELKAEVMKKRLLDINPELELKTFPIYLKDNNKDEILDSNAYDYVADCIDTLSPKVYLIQACLQRNIPLVSSMGAGGKLDPTQVRVINLWDSYNCQLAYYVRKRLARFGHKNQSIKAVWSPEKPDKERVILAPEGNVKKSIIGTMSYIPAVFGCVVASVVIRDLATKKAT